MAIRRSMFESQMFNHVHQIIENWCLVRWADMYPVDGAPINRNHWASELKAHIKNIIDIQIKGSKKDKVIQHVLLKAYELDNSDRVAAIIRDKFSDEGLEKYVNVISQDCVDHIEDICRVLASKDISDVDDYVNGMMC